MTSREIASLACKLLASLNIATGLLSFPFFFISGPSNLDYIYSAFSLLGGIILWNFAEPISSRIFSEPMEVNDAKPKSSSTYSIALSIFGLYIVTTFIRDISFLLAFVVDKISDPSDQSSFSDPISASRYLISAILHVGFGLWMIHQSETIAERISGRVDRAQPQPESSSNQ